jgi:hypothetical protein
MKSEPSQRLQVATDRCGDRAEPRNEFVKNCRQQCLVTVAFSEIRGIMHLDHERVRTGGEGSEGHLRNKLAQTDRVRWIDNDRQMCFGF